MNHIEIMSCFSIVFYFEHTQCLICQTAYKGMAKDFCHICNDGGKKCFKINDTLEYAMLKMAPKCPSCGRSLIE